MPTNRIYKKRRTIGNALEELTTCSGTQFDPKVVEYAVHALKDVTEENSVSQLPVSGSDFERMAYHFKDNTTNLYNKSFLSVFIETEEWRSQICCGMHIALKGFDEYSISTGWENGRTLLAGFASRMEATYPKSFIFRIARSAFVILSREPEDFSSFIEEQAAMLEEHGITLTAEAIDLVADGIREWLQGRMNRSDNVNVSKARSSLLILPRTRPS